MSAFHIAGQEWRPVSIVCALPYGQFLVEERDRPLPGRFVAFRSDLRVECGVYTYRTGVEVAPTLRVSAENRGARSAQ